MTTSDATERTLRGDRETRALGGRLAGTLPAVARKSGAIICLSGHLGAGKTTLVKGLAEGLGVADEDEVTSPTFLRMVRYDGALDLLHVDAYRMQGEGDVHELGLDEDLAGGALVAIEWPEMIADALPRDVLLVEIEHESEGSRRVRFAAGGPVSAAWLTALLDAWAS